MTILRPSTIILKRPPSIISVCKVWKVYQAKPLSGENWLQSSESRRKRKLLLVSHEESPPPPPLSILLLLLLLTCLSFTCSAAKASWFSCSLLITCCRLQHLSDNACLYNQTKVEDFRFPLSYCDYTISWQRSHDFGNDGIVCY